ncbi:MAG: hypothetical protein ABWK00_05030 [Desulfurococcaceae archaeon]
MVLSLDFVDGRYKLEYLGRTIVIGLYLCNRLHEALEEELVGLGISGRTSIIPAGCIESPAAALQGAIHVALFGTLGIRNPGLALASMALGEWRLERLVEILKECYVNSEKHYVVTLDDYKPPENMCRPVAPGELFEGSFTGLVKNVLLLLERA